MVKFLNREEYAMHLSLLLIFGFLNLALKDVENESQTFDLQTLVLA